MTRSLPLRPNLEFLKREAHALLRAHRQSDPACCAVLRHLHRFTEVPDTAILGATVTLAEMQFALAMDYGFTSWRALKDAVMQADRRKLLHIFSLEIPADLFRQCGQPGTVVVWRDPLIEGPAPAGLSEEAWLAVRADNLRDIFDTRAQGMQALANMDRQLATYPDYDEVVLWFDACLYDQITLIRQLDWFSRREMGSTALRLICTGEFPGLPVFHGLGELTPEQLCSLLPSRQPVTAAQTALAVRAWAAYRAPDPTAIERLLADDTSVLPFLRPALLRHLQRFPSMRNGLCRLEQELLAAVADGCQDFPALFLRASDQETPAFFGDTLLFRHLEALASGRVPLLAMRGLEDARDLPRREWPIARTAYVLTDAGRVVLAGEADRITLNGGIDRWLGGVHLQETAVWRWDDRRMRLVPPAG